MTATSSIEKPFNPEMANASGSSKREADADAAAVQEPAAEPASPRSIHGILWVLVVMSTLSSIFLYAMDNTVVADVTPVSTNALPHLIGNGVETAGWLTCVLDRRQ